MTKLRMKPDDWLKQPQFQGMTILDPDGWDRHPDRWEQSWNTPISAEEFILRANASTCRFKTARYEATK